MDARRTLAVFLTITGLTVLTATAVAQSNDISVPEEPDIEPQGDIHPAVAENLYIHRGEGGRIHDAILTNDNPVNMKSYTGEWDSGDDFYIWSVEDAQMTFQTLIPFGGAGMKDRDTMAGFSAEKGIWNPAQDVSNNAQSDFEEIFIECHGGVSRGACGAEYGTQLETYEPHSRFRQQSKGFLTDDFDTKIHLYDGPASSESTSADVVGEVAFGSFPSGIDQDLIPEGYSAGENYWMVCRSGAVMADGSTPLMVSVPERTPDKLNPFTGSDQTWACDASSGEGEWVPIENQESIVREDTAQATGGEDFNQEMQVDNLDLEPSTDTAGTEVDLEVQFEGEYAEQVYVKTAGSSDTKVVGEAKACESDCTFTRTYEHDGEGTVTFEARAKGDNQGSIDESGERGTQRTSPPAEVEFTGDEGDNTQSEDSGNEDNQDETPDEQQDEENQDDSESEAQREGEFEIESAPDDFDTIEWDGEVLDFSAAENDFQVDGSTAYWEDKAYHITWTLEQNGETEFQLEDAGGFDSVAFGDEARKPVAELDGNRFEFTIEYADEYQGTPDKTVTGTYYAPIDSGTEGETDEETQDDEEPSDNTYVDVGTQYSGSESIDAEISIAEDEAGTEYKIIHENPAGNEETIDTVEAGSTRIGLGEAQELETGIHTLRISIGKSDFVEDPVLDSARFRVNEESEETQEDETTDQEEEDQTGETGGQETSSEDTPRWIEYCDEEFGDSSNVYAGRVDCIEQELKPAFFQTEEPSDELDIEIARSFCEDMELGEYNEDETACDPDQG